jgi:CRP-like cAMP-binding protein
MPRWPKEKARALLLRGAWFVGLPGPVQDELLASGRVRRHPRATEIHIWNSPPSDLHALLEGAVRLSKVGEAGNEIVLHVCRPGFWFGCLSAIAGLDAGMTATAIDAVTLLSVPASAIERLVRAEPRYLSSLVRLPLQRFVNLLEAMEQASRPTARNRLAAKLLALDALQEETDVAAVDDPLPISQATLAEMTGLSRQTVNRMLRGLVRSGAIAVGFRAISILARRQLERMAVEAG